MKTISAAFVFGIILVACQQTAIAQAVKADGPEMRKHFKVMSTKLGHDIAAHRWAEDKKKARSAWLIGEKGHKRLWYEIYVISKKHADWADINPSQGEQPHTYAVDKGYLTGFYNGEYKKPYRGITMIKKGSADLIWAKESELERHDGDFRKQVQKWATLPSDGRPKYAAARYVGKKKDFADGTRYLVVAFPKGGK